MQNHLGTSEIVLDGEVSEPREASKSLQYGATEAEVVSDAGFEAEYDFTGKERDEESGLDYFGARYMSPVLARWCSPDPVTTHQPEGAVDALALNPYVPVRASPLQFVD